MKIVQINATYGVGSTGHIVADLHRAAMAAGHSSYAFWGSRCSENCKDEPNIVRIGHVLDHKLHAVARRLTESQGFHSRSATRTLCKSLDRIAPDIVHLHNLHSNYLHLPTLLTYLADKHIPVVITLHDCWIFTGSCYHFLNYGNCGKWTADGCVGCPAVKSERAGKQVAAHFKIKKTLFDALPALGVIGVSDWITDCGRRSCLGDADKLERIYNWIDSELFSPHADTDAVKDAYGIDKTRKLILGVAQGWSSQKGVDECILLSERLGNEATVVLVGDPCGHESTEHLRFIGYTSSPEELAGLYAAADVFVNPSRMETFGKVTAEALSCGTPVVAYNNTGTAELVDDRVGALVPDGDSQAMLDTVKRFLHTDKSLYSDACRRSAVERFNKAALLDRHLDFYSELCRILP